MHPRAAAIVVAATIAATTAHAAAYPQLAVPQVAVPEAAKLSLDPNAPPSAWTNAGSLQLPWDPVRSRPASELTKAWIATDGRALYVRFDAAQREPIIAQQHTNDVGQGSDDEVWIDLWPNGVNGYFYQFYATPNGTHYEYSSENTAYSPNWESQGAAHGSGYTVTMKIPLEVIRNARGGSWKAQFVRYVRATGEQQVWSFDRVQMQPDSYGNADYAHAGSISVPPLTIGSLRPKPRAAVYALGEAASRTIGGSTSRIGADLSIPITPTASFYSTFHPDYSNVELDQQSIAPTVYQRYYSEVRPFFTQAASFYNDFNCDACPNIQALYTPAIPTPAEGYAVEGKQGPFGFATFDAIGDNRNDLASAIDYTSPNAMWGSSIQRVAVNLPGFVDTATEAGVAYNDLKHMSAYFNYGNDSGTNVLVPSQAQYYDVGGGWANQTFGFFGSTRKVGEYYNPVDGFVSHPGIAGYALYAAKIWDFDSNDQLVSAGVAGFVDRYQGPTMGQAQSDNQIIVDLLTKHALDLQLFSGSNYWRFGDVLTPVSQNGGFQLTYDSGLQTNNPGNFPNHGPSATPTTINYSTGRYGLGRLDTWFRTTTIRVGNHGALTLALDDTAQWIPAPNPSNVQWFESLSYAYQIGRNSSLAIGLRRVVGDPPIPNGGGDCIGTCSNISVAYHLRLRNSEFYLAYGNPNTLITVPQAIFKVIFYGGAAKGT
ncbi:MAG: hypothetical protein JOZ77_12035 [Candidatus Eremiobacteraeota bacterium]|nr:hypothetical protein [Candidatus Eremiobacteraeota bacterium]